MDSMDFELYTSFHNKIEYFKKFIILYAWNR